MEKKAFGQNSDKFGYSVISNEFCIYQKTIILGLFKIDALNFTMYMITILTCPLKPYVIRLHNLISMKIFFTEIKIIVFFIIVKRQINCWIKKIIRSSRSPMFFEIGVLKNVLICKGKHQSWSLFPINLHACNFIKKDSNIVVFL